MKPPPAEKFLYPKELALELEHRYGISGLGARACRRLVRELKAERVATLRKTQCRATDAAAWILSHPDWCPFPRRPPNRQRGLPLSVR